MDFFKSRMLVIQAIFLLTLMIFLGKLFHLQIIEKSYKELASQNVVRRIQLHADRGIIYDRNGKLLVTNDAVYDLYVIPRQVSKQLDTLKFCELLNLDVDFFEKQLMKCFQYSRYRPSLFLKQITTEDFARFQEYLHRFPGFYSELRTIRRYPYKSAMHVLGYVGEVDQNMIANSKYYKSGDFIGINGLEKIYEEELRGTRGSKFIMVDVHNRDKGPFKNGALDTFAISGKDLRISIDITLQMYGELLMQNKKGSIVAIEPATGEILALVSSPTFDPNLLSGRMRGENFKKLSEDTLKPLYNRPIMGFYPPGSTFKPLMALIGLQEKTLSPGSTYSCRPGYHAAGLTIGCRPHPTVMNLSESLQQSCNAYYCHVFRNILDQSKYKNTQESFAVWTEYVNSFGLGQKMGIDIPNEMGGLVPNPDYYNRLYKNQSWKSLTIISLGIGQGELGTTPLQMANMTTAIANQGFYYTPHLVKNIEDLQSEKLEKYRTPHYTKVEQSKFPPVVEGMFQTVEKGTARASRIPGLEACGKTGTAQNPQGEDNSLYISFAPMNNPKIAIAVVVENAGGGSKFAAPIASLMIEKYLNDTISTQRLALEKRMLETDLIHIADEKKELAVRP